MAATTIRLRQTVAMLSTAALVASMTVAIVAAPAVAAKPKCDGKVATIVSTKQVIQGTNGADVIVARGTKNNIIYGKGGRDRICAGGGNDHVYGGSGNDRIFGGSGDDDLFGQTGRDDLFGFAGTDVMNGGAHDDFLSGGAGDDRMEGGPGNDVARGGLGPDSIGGSAGDDKLYGQQGNDLLNGGDGVDVCVQGQGNGPITDCEPAEPAPTPAPTPTPDPLAAYQAQCASDGGMYQTGYFVSSQTWDYGCIWDDGTSPYGADVAAQEAAAAVYHPLCEAIKPGGVTSATGFQLPAHPDYTVCRLTS